MIRPEAYVQKSAVSQSSLLTFEKDIVQFYHEEILGEAREIKKSDALDLGSLVDAIILDPEALKGYYVLTALKATGKVKEVVDLVALKIKDKIDKNPEVAHSQLLADYPYMIEPIIDELKYQPKWNLNTRIEKIINDGQQYYEQLLEADGKVMVPMEVWTKAHTIVDGIVEDEFTGEVFDTLKNGKKGWEVMTSTPLFGVEHTEDGKEELKALMDFFFINHKKKIISPWDLKTCKNLARFMMNYRISKYGRQGAFYTALLKQNYPGYEVEPFEFLAIPTESLEKPERFRMSQSELMANTEGGESPGGYHIYGYKELVAEVAWHRANAKWQHRKSYYQKGVNIIDFNTNVDPSLLSNSEEVLF